MKIAISLKGKKMYEGEYMHPELNGDVYLCSYHNINRRSIKFMDLYNRQTLRRMKISGKKVVKFLKNKSR